MHGIMRGHDNR